MVSPFVGASPSSMMRTWQQRRSHRLLEWRVGSPQRRTGGRERTSRHVGHISRALDPLCRGRVATQHTVPTSPRRPDWDTFHGGDGRVEVGTVRCVATRPGRRVDGPDMCPTWRDVPSPRSSLWRPNPPTRSRLLLRCSEVLLIDNGAAPPRNGDDPNSTINPDQAPAAANALTRHILRLSVRALAAAGAWSGSIVEFTSAACTVVSVSWRCGSVVDERTPLQRRSNRLLVGGLGRPQRRRGDGKGHLAMSGTYPARSTLSAEDGLHAALGARLAEPSSALG